MPDPAPVSDADFTREFLYRAVTVERVSAALDSLASKRFEFGPYSAALAGVASTGTLGRARIVARNGDTPVFDVTVPATLDLTVRLGVESHLQADVEIDLVLTPRPAFPLLLVIDIAPLSAKDVRIDVRGRGLGASIGAVLSAVTDELRSQIARQVTGVLDSNGLRRSRTIDVAARVDGKAVAAPARTEWQWITDERFGSLFIRHAVTEERVAAALAGLGGQPVEIGPLRTGPRGLATVRAAGAVGEPAVRGAAGSFDITIPLALDLVVDVKRANNYHADVSVHLVAKPYPAQGLHIVVGIAEVVPGDVTVQVEAAGALAGLLGRVGRIDDQIASQVARQVNERVAAAARVVDIGARIDGGGAVRRPRPRPSRPGA